jgi:hypothetical protein
VFVLLIRCIPGNVVAQTENFLTYTNTNYGFTIKYPSDWNVDESAIHTTGIKLESPDGAGNVLVSRVPNVTSIDELKGTIGQMQAHGFRLTELNTDTYFLSGYPAIRAIGIASFGGPGEPGASQGVPPHDVKMMIYVIISWGYAYMVAYMAPPDTYSNDLSDAQQIIDSFEITNTTSTSTQTETSTSESTCILGLNNTCFSMGYEDGLNNPESQCLPDNNMNASQASAYCAGFNDSHQKNMTSSTIPSSWQSVGRLDYDLRYPSNWTSSSDLEGYGMILRPTQNTSMTLEVNIQDVWESFSQELKSAKFELTSMNVDNTSISGHPAVRITGLVPSHSAFYPGEKMMIVLSQFGGRIYKIVYYGTPETYNLFLPTVQQIIGSLKVPGGG